LPELLPYEVCVWTTSLEISAQAIEPSWAMLDAAERERALRFTRELDRRWFVARRGFRRAVLAGYLGCEPAAVRFARRSGKPEVDGGDLRFSSSHSRGLALVAVTRGRRVGVDVECVRRVRDSEAIAYSLFTPRERAALTAEPPERRDRSFLGIWTRKEALVKCTGEGLRGAFGSLEASASALGQRWSLEALAPTPGSVAAVAAEGTGVRVQCRAW
jgi:4'-phosphopantetheinyl transferase